MFHDTGDSMLDEHGFPVTSPGPSVLTQSASVLAVKYKGGILLASDNSVAYGSHLHYTGFSHFFQLTPQVLLGAAGELADFQALTKELTIQVTREECRTGGRTLLPSEIHCYIKRLMYGRRSRMRPLAITVVIAGLNPDGSTLLAATDLYGASWEDDLIGAGMAKHLQGCQISSVVNQEREKVYEAMNEVWKGIYTRDILQRGALEYFDVSGDGIRQLEDVRIKIDWAGRNQNWGADLVQ
jgi:20S proteasome subunit beta 7